MSLLNCRWSLIAGRLPGRTDNEIKNYWNTNLKKKLLPQHSPHKQRTKFKSNTPLPRNSSSHHTVIRTKAVRCMQLDFSHAFPTSSQPGTLCPPDFDMGQVFGSDGFSSFFHPSEGMTEDNNVVGGDLPSSWPDEDVEGDIDTFSKFSLTSENINKNKIFGNASFKFCSTSFLLVFHSFVIRIGEIKNNFSFII